jgi:cytochrome c oxidase cbb3-type subunit 3
MKILSLLLAVSFTITSCNETQRGRTGAKTDSTRVEQVSNLFLFSTQGISVQPRPVGVELTYAAEKGKRVFRKYCVICHGETGMGDGFNAYNLNPRPRDFTNDKYMTALSDEKLAETISQGGRGTNKSVLMPAWGNTVSQNDIQNLVAYLRAFAKPDTAKKG